MVDPERERAKEIIVEIIRQAGGVFDFTTNLYKAFYYAHLRFADAQAGYLSAWPIVRMPCGPGIGRGKSLLLELVAENKIKICEINQGRHKGFRFMVGAKAASLGSLPEGAMDAIAYGVQQVAGKTATQNSHESHRKSRAWREAADGEELNIYLDSLSDEEYEKRMRTARDLKRAMDAVWE